MAERDGLRGPSATARANSPRDQPCRFRPDSFDASVKDPTPVRPTPILRDEIMTMHTTTPAEPATTTERRVVLLMGMSLDGFGAWGWSPPAASTPDRDAIHDEIRRQLAPIDTFLLGRACYQLWETFWPSVAHSATSSPFEKEFSHLADEMQKVVYSKTLTTAAWRNTRLVNGSLTDDVARMKRTPGRNLAIVGGPTIARAFGNLGLIDEYRLWAHPTLLGTGTPLLGSDGRRRDLELLDVRSFGSAGCCFHLRPRPVPR